MIESLGNYYYDKGISLAYENRLTLAIEQFKKASAINGDNYDLYNVMGLCFYALGDFQRAKILWLRSIKLNEFEDNKAYAYLEDLESQEFKNVIANFNKALSFGEEGQYRKAIDILNSKDFSCHNFVKFRNILGLYSMAEGDEKRARESWRKALKLDKNNPDTINYLTSDWNITGKSGLLDKLRHVLRNFRA